MLMLRYCGNVPAAVAVSIFDQIASLPLHSRTPPSWAHQALSDPIALLIDHAFLEKKAANNAMDLLARWPADYFPGWVITMSNIARDEGAHLARVTQLLVRRGGQLERGHSNPYAKALRLLVRKGGTNEILDRLFNSALIEARSCERFGLLAMELKEAALKQSKDSDDPELAALYNLLFTSELGHYQAFLKLARQIVAPEIVEVRWQEMLAREAEILAEQAPGTRMHSGWSV